MTHRPRINRVHRYKWRDGTKTTEGIVLYSGNRIVAHLTPPEAYKLANRIVDKTEELERKQPQMNDIHPLKHLASLHGQEIHSITPSMPIESSDGEPIGMTSPLRITGGMIGLIVTQREADEADLDYDTPGLTVINEYGDIIVQNSMGD